MVQHRVVLHPRPPLITNGLGIAGLIARIAGHKLASGDAAGATCRALGYEIEDEGARIALRYELALSGNNNDRARAALRERSDVFRRLVDDIAAEDGRASVDWSDFETDAKIVWKSLSPGGAS